MPKTAAPGVRVREHKKRKIGLHPVTNRCYKLVFHSLRHTFASWLSDKEVDIRVIQRLRSHASVSTTEIYSYLRDEKAREAVKSLENIDPCVPE